MQRRIVLSLLVTAALIQFYGCTPIQHHVKIGYIPDEPVDKPGMGEVVYVATARDNHRGRPLIGMRDNKMGKQVLLEDGQDLSDIVTDAVIDTMEASGYAVRDEWGHGAHSYENDKDAKVLKAYISDFWFDEYSEWHLLGYRDWLSVRVGLIFKLDSRATGKTLWEKEVRKSFKDSAQEISSGTSTLKPGEHTLNRLFGEAMTDFQAAIAGADFKNALFMKAADEGTK